MSSSSIVLNSSRSIGDKYAHWICMFVCVCVWTKSYTFYSVFARIMHISKPATKMSIVQEFFFDRQRPRWQLLPFKLRHLVTTAEILDNAEIEMEIFRLEHELLADTAQYVVSNGNHCARRFRADIKSMRCDATSCNPVNGEHRPIWSHSLQIQSNSKLAWACSSQSRVSNFFHLFVSK